MIGVEIASWLVTIAGIYVVLGALFGLAFVTTGVARIDPAARGGSFGFRLLILPGVIAFWPWLLARWLRGSGPPDERNAHRLLAGRESER